MKDIILESDNDFKDLGLSKETIQVLQKKGFKKPTEIQSRAIPLLLEGKKDVIGRSQTGTGKTAAFALPILEKIKQSKFVQAIILAPTRELAVQIAQDIESFKGNKKVRVLAVYGGASIVPQRQALRDGVDIVVGTPGRVMDLQRRGYLKINTVKYVVLDEADEMLNMGFVEDIETILKTSPKDKNMLLFSATMPKSILKIAQTYMRDYEIIEVKKTQATTIDVEQVYYDINSKDRLEGLKRIIDYHSDFYGIVFCNTKVEVDSINQQLIKFGYKTASLHGDIPQSQREKILQQFKNKYIRILIATDVAARGIDVNDLTHVVNYSLPQSPEAYVHRIGRTGRAGKKGVSITFVIPSERGKLNFVERINNCRLQKRDFPSAKEIIKNKESRIKTIIANIIKANQGKKTNYTNIAQDLLNTGNPHDVVSAILKYSFNNDFDASAYKDLSKVIPSSKRFFNSNQRRGSGFRRSGGGRRRSFNRNRSNTETFSKRRSSRRKERAYKK